MKQKKASLPAGPKLVLAAIALLLVGGVLFAALYTPPIELPYLTARNLVIYDVNRGRVVYDKGGDEPRSPASLTKLMSLFLIYDMLDAGELHYDDTYTVTPAEAMTPGSKYGMEPGEVFTVEQLMAGVILRSGCDCIQCLVRLASGNEGLFVAQMNEKAVNLGLEGTHFINATGIDASGHYMTALDLAALTAALVTAHPEVLELSAQATAKVGDRTFQNMHRLVGQDPRVLGLKTGTTQIGGFNLVTYARQDGQDYIIVLLDSNNGDSRFTETTTVLDVLYGDDGHGA